MGSSQKSNYRKKIVSFFLTLGKFLEALGSGIGTCLVFCHSFSLSNNVHCELQRFAFFNTLYIVTILQGRGNTSSLISYGRNWIFIFSILRGRWKKRLEWWRKHKARYFCKSFSLTMCWFLPEGQCFGPKFAGISISCAEKTSRLADLLQVCKLKVRFRPGAL